MSRAGSRFACGAAWYVDSVLQSLLFAPVHRAVLEQLRPHAPQAASVLAVGCGTGRLLQAAACSRPLAVGVDPCPPMLDAARRPGASTAPVFVCARAERLPFAAGTFDAVASTWSLRFWEDPARGIHELARVLSEAGTLVIADAEPDRSPTPKRRRWGFGRSDGQLRFLVVRSGLTVIDDQVAPTHGPVFGIRRRRLPVGTGQSSQPSSCG
jgi:ubiquinone/menaquinone biosynthesis C-methylase UbiE